MQEMMNEDKISLSDNEGDENEEMEEDDEAQ
jgi:hypothetical protein